MGPHHPDGENEVLQARWSYIHPDNVKAYLKNHLMFQGNHEMSDLKDVAKYTQSYKKLTTLATSKIQQNSSFQWTYASGCLFVEVWLYCWGCASGESGRPLRAGEGGIWWPVLVALPLDGLPEDGVLTYTCPALAASSPKCWY